MSTESYPAGALAPQMEGEIWDEEYRRVPRSRRRLRWQLTHNVNK